MTYLHNDVFLAHYGVQGMKWGVRRERMQRAREVYSLGRGNTRALRRLSKIDAKIGKKMHNGKDLGKLEIKRKQVLDIQKKIQSVMKTKMKDLTSKELHIGAAQAIVGRMLKSATIGGLTVGAIAASGGLALGMTFTGLGITGVSTAALAGVSGLAGTGVGTTIGGTGSLLRSARRR